MRYWILMLCLFIAGCSSSASEQALPTLVEFPTETETLIPTETFTPTATETATDTPEPTVTDTIVLTDTSTATIAPSSTALPAPSVTSTPVVQASETPSYGAEEDVIVAWLNEQDGVDVVETISLDTPDNTNPFFYVELIVYPGYNDLLLAVALKDYVSDEFSIGDFESFDVNISDGVVAVNYYYGSGEWTSTTLTLVTPPTPRPQD